MEKTKELVLNYFKAFQMKDWEQLRSCLDTNFQVDGGQLQFPSIEVFFAFCQNGPCWSPTQLLDAVFVNNQAALLYEAKTPKGEKMRIGEFLTIVDNKIRHSKIIISLG